MAAILVFLCKLECHVSHTPPHKNRQCLINIYIHQLLRTRLDTCSLVMGSVIVPS